MANLAGVRVYAHLCAEASPQRARKRALLATLLRRRRRTPGGFRGIFRTRTMHRNEKVFGLSGAAYEGPTKNAGLLVCLMGENHARAACFGGDKRQVQKLSQLVDDWKKSGDDFPHVDVITGADPRTEPLRSTKISGYSENRISWD